MIIGLGDIYVQIPHRQVAEGVMTEASRHAQAEDGCLSFTFAEVLEEPGHFVVLERWNDERAIERHYRSPAFADYQRSIARLLVRESEYRLHRVQDTSHPVDSVRIVTDQDD
ncbi:MAG TPA: antibiotic biosynthesis monooxygenase [Solirubrobacteraceae bacterium]|nr:antibiotic biosynthesis monooxygenase [Solirubrobacteraceae bacterium]